MHTTLRNKYVCSSHALSTHGKEDENSTQLREHDGKRLSELFVLFRTCPVRSAALLSHPPTTSSSFATGLQHFPVLILNAALLHSLVRLCGCAVVVLCVYKREGEGHTPRLKEEESQRLRAETESMCSWISTRV